MPADQASALPHDSFPPRLFSVRQRSLRQGRRRRTGVGVAGVVRRRPVRVPIGLDERGAARGRRRRHHAGIVLLGSARPHLQQRTGLFGALAFVALVGSIRRALGVWSTLPITLLIPSLSFSSGNAAHGSAGGGLPRAQSSPVPRQMRPAPVRVSAKVLLDES